MNSARLSAELHFSMSLVQFVDQIRAMKEQGPLPAHLGMLPGEIGRMAAEVRETEFEKTLQHLHAIVDAMSPEERDDPEFGSGPRARRRIAELAGLPLSVVSTVFDQFFAARRTAHR
jgi:signal recognition particle subunit SRP54